MALRFTTDLPTAEQHWRLFETTGWSPLRWATPEALLRAVQNSWLSISVYDGDTLVGFGRLVTDGVVHAMIYDLIVMPAYQGQGIGSRILTMLLDACHEAGIPQIQLFCAPGKRAFYEKRGFYVRPDDAPGMQYRLDTNRP